MTGEIQFIIFMLTVVGCAAFCMWRHKANTPTEAEYTHLLSAAIAAERYEAELRSRRDCTRTSFEQAQFEVKLRRAEQHAGLARWEAHSAGIKAGIVEDLSW
jgi:Tfp pilus assembly protein FimV